MIKILIINYVGTGNIDVGTGRDLPLPFCYENLSPEIIFIVNSSFNMEFK
jgi:hypothetical protein